VPAAPPQRDQLAGDLRLLAPLTVGRAARLEAGDGVWQNEQA
jgi:hypothetical protein